MPKAPTKVNQLASTPRQAPYPAPSVRRPSTSMAGTCPTSSDRRTATPWNSSDDKRLIDARHQGLSWKHIAPEHFPDKTPNACRKRHERLMDKRNNQDNLGGQKFETFARAYYENREKIWGILAELLHEKWEDVERKCMEKGLKTVKNTGQMAVRRDESDDCGLVIDSDASRPCSDIDREEHHPYSRSENNDHLGSYKTVISSNHGQVYHNRYSSQRDDRSSSVSYASTNAIPAASFPSRFSPTSSATSFSRTSPSNQPQQLPRLNSLGIQNDLPKNGLPGVAQMLLPSVSTH